MKFIAIKTEDGVIKGKLSFYCRMLGVSRQGFYKYLAIKDRPWKYQDLADAMRAINSEDECNDTYGRIRMYQALLLKNLEGLKIPSERTVYRVMDEIGLSHRPKRKPNGITRADREARKSDDLLKRDFKSNKPLEKCVTDINLIRIYFQDTAAKGITARNQLIEMATASLSDLMKEHPEHRAEAKQDLQLLNAQKMGEHEAEIEKIKNVFLAILRDIKKDIDNGEQPGEAVTAAMFQAMRDALAEQKQKPLSIDDVTAMIAGQIGQLTPMDKETVEMFQQFAKKMIEQAGTK